MIIQTESIPMTEVEEIIAHDSEGVVEARWNSVTGEIKFIDIETGMKINDTVHIVNDRNAAIATSKTMLRDKT